MFFSYEHLQLRYEPFPIGLAKPIMDESTYNELVDNFPPPEMFVSLAKVGYKYTLSERFNRPVYEKFIRSRPIWREFHRWIKSDDFIRGVMNALRERYIDLGYDDSPLPLWKRFRKGLKEIVHGRIDLSGNPPLQARFEFSSLPVDGGSVIPHTDAPGKVVTLVLSMLHEGEWNPTFGGGTDVNHPKDERLSFNYLNRQADFDDMEVVETYAFTPNQAVIFVKTFNSWHSVRPMTGAGSAGRRRTLTINIETTDRAAVFAR
jgi:hypothetical protein